MAKNQSNIAREPCFIRKDKTWQPASFLQWITIGDCNSVYAIIEMSDGSLTQIMITNVRFQPPK